MGCVFELPNCNGETVVNAEVGRLAGGTTASLAGSLGGFFLGTHQGVPITLLIAAIGGAICFGLVSSTERQRDRTERGYLRRMAIANFGTLWMLACATVFALNISFPLAVIIGLSCGLFGSAVLERIESSEFFNDLATKLAKWWLGRGVK